MLRVQPINAKQQRGGRAFLDKESGGVKWVNCSSVTAIMSNAKE